jgi:hypothetical protein
VRSLIAGVDDRGRSCIVTEVPVKDPDINAGGARPVPTYTS